MFRSSINLVRDKQHKYLQHLGKVFSWNKHTIAFYLTKLYHFCKQHSRELWSQMKFHMQCKFYFQLKMVDPLSISIFTIEYLALIQFCMLCSLSICLTKSWVARTQRRSCRSAHKACRLSIRKFYLLYPIFCPNCTQNRFGWLSPTQYCMQHMYFYWLRKGYLQDKSTKVFMGLFGSLKDT